MHRRSFHPRFRDPILQGIKTTTIRDKPWPIGVPIMAFSWTGKPYRSKQQDIAAVVVEATETVRLTRNALGNIMTTPCVPRLCESSQLWECEGFDSFDAFCDWFRPLIKPGQTLTKTLHRFHVSQS